MAKKQAAQSLANPVPTKKKKTSGSNGNSQILTFVSFLIHFLVFIPIFALSIVLCYQCYELVPYYTFWPFVGSILVGVFAIIFWIVALIVGRKKSKASIMSQTIRIVITFICLTTGFGLIETFVMPDIIAQATQSTLYVEDLTYSAYNQAQTNAELERDFIKINLLAGNLNDFSNNISYAYSDLSEFAEEDGIISYSNDTIQNSYTAYANESSVSFSKKIENLSLNPLKEELYKFIYQNYVLMDYNYALKTSDLGIQQRRALCLSVTDYIYTAYSKFVAEGFSNARLKELFNTTFGALDRDGYQTYDDSLLLMAQQGGRLTVPVIVHLILDERWASTQVSYDDEGNKFYPEDGNYLLEIYDRKAVEAYVAWCEDEGKTPFDKTKTAADGTIVNYGYNEDGWICYETGMVKRPAYWTVLDMQGSGLDVTSVSLGDISFNISGTQIELGTFLPILDQFPDLTKSLGQLLENGVGGVIETAANGGKLYLALYFDDNMNLVISVQPSAFRQATLGYQQMSWIQSDNLLYAVMTVVGIRNYLLYFGIVGTGMLIVAGILRDFAKKSRQRRAGLIEKRDEKEQMQIRVGEIVRLNEAIAHLRDKAENATKYKQEQEMERLRNEVHALEDIIAGTPFAEESLVTPPKKSKKRSKKNAEETEVKEEVAPVSAPIEEAPQQDEAPVEDVAEETQVPETPAEETPVEEASEEKEA